MGLSYKARRRWALVLLLVWLPAYVVGAVSLMNYIDRLPFVLELVAYVVLGFGWAVPFRFVFRGVGAADPDASDTGDK